MALGDLSDGLDVLAVEILKGDDLVWGDEVRFSINGTPLLDLLGVNRAGDWIGPPSRVVGTTDHLLGGPDRWEDPNDPWFPDGRVAVGACSCGQPGCDALLVRVQMMTDTVLWSQFEHYRRPARLATIGPFEFDRGRYEATVRSVAPGT